MRAAVADHPNGAALHVDFYDRERVAAPVNRHPGVAAWFGEGEAGGCPAGVRSGDWAGSAAGQGSAFLIDKTACLVRQRSDPPATAYPSTTR